jgi:toxin ParE1/3/4
MASSIASYELSPEAEQDLSNIFDYTEKEFGLDQAVQYLKDLERCFIQLCNNPNIGCERTEILNVRLRVVCVLHGSRDLPKHF